jgi:hypothetical protein
VTLGPVVLAFNYGKFVSSRASTRSASLVERQKGHENGTI